MDSDSLSCPIYDNHLNKMLSKMNEAKIDEEKLKVMMEFAERFTLLPDQWTELLRLSKQCKKQLPPNLNFRLFSTCYGDKNVKNIEWSNKANIISELNDYNSKDRFELAEAALSFPHKQLNAIFERYLFNSVKPVANELRNKFQRNKKLYHKIKATKNDIDKWLKCIKEIEDKEVVIANIELKLGQDANWKNKKLWDFYFGFLEEKSMKEILDVYRRYTRLFISDKEAVEKCCVEKMLSQWNEPTTKYWIDTIKYEMDFGDLKFAYRLLEQAMKAVVGKPYHFTFKDEKDLCEKLKICGTVMMQIENNRTSAKMPNNQTEVKHVSPKPTVYFENPKFQNLQFRRSFIQNLFENANATVLKKLYSTCKFFYWLTQAPLCHRLEICSDKKTSYCQESLYVNEKDIDFAGLERIHAYSIIVVGKCADRNILSKALPKLKQCNISFMLIQKQDFSVADFKFMLSKDIFQISLYEVNIIEENGEKISVKNVIEILKNYPFLIGLEFVNQDHFIVSSSSPSERVSRWKAFSSQFQFGNIYIQNQSCSILDLQAFIDYYATKHVTLRNVTVKDEKKLKMEKKEIEEFIKSEINPMNQVLIEIME